MIRKFCWLVSIILTGCAAGSQFLYVEPNPETPSPGQGYVDFFVTTPKAECVLQVYHLSKGRALTGGEFQKRERVDSHAYLAELAQAGSRLVRVATAPGPQDFSVEARSPVISSQSALCPSADVTVTVREGMITPVHLGRDGNLGPGAILDPIPYGRKESMPYNAAPGPDLELQLIELAAQLDPNGKRADGTTALMRASGKGRADYVKVLLAAHADPNLSMADGNTALLLAVSKKHADVVQLLLDGGANPNLADKKGNTALASAVGQGNLELVRSLLKSGAKADVPTPEGKALLPAALENRQLDIALALVNGGAPIDAANLDAQSSLLIAARQGYVPVVQAMVTRNPQLATNSPAWRLAFVAAIDTGKADMVQVLLDANQAPDVHMGGAPLAHAAQLGDATIVSLLLARKFDIAQSGSDGITPLMAAASRGNTTAAQLLIDAGAPINTRGHDGSTALMWAAQVGNEDIVRALIAHHADANFQSVNGMTALDVAQDGGHASIVSMLKAVTSPQTVAAMSWSDLLRPPAVKVTDGGSGIVTFSAKEDGTAAIKTTVASSDGKVYLTDVVLKSQLTIRSSGFNTQASVRGPILSGTLYAMDTGGHVLPLTAGMAMEQLYKEARARNVSLTREGFTGFRIGEVAIYFVGDKVGDVSFGE